MRIQNTQIMNKYLSVLPDVITPKAPAGYHHVYQLYSIRVPEQLRDGLIKHLANNSIMSKVFFYPVHKTSFYSDKLGYDCSLPVTEEVSKQILSLPMYPELTEKEISLITNQISSYIAGRK